LHGELEVTPELLCVLKSAANEIVKKYFDSTA